ncbi:hypothetical protein [Prosthecobacter sp.]|uniref:hypothetical protein n=1 Tax=Prosthecobacter sp. TaxID=1965333 RepID=UPI0037847C3C
MKLSSLFFGDFADLFQDDRIDKATYEAESALLSARSTSVRHAQILKDANEKILQLERDNALLGLVLLGLLRRSPSAEVEALAGEVRSLMADNEKAPPRSLKFLRDALGLPPVSEQPGGIYKKPVAATPLRTPGPLQTPPQPKGPRPPGARK